MKIVVIADSNTDRSIEICCGFLSFRDIDYSRVPRSVDNVTADLVITTPASLCSKTISAGRLFVVSVTFDNNKIPDNADIVFESAQEEEIVFRLVACIDSISKTESTQSQLLNNIFARSYSIQLLISRDGTVERFWNGTAGTDEEIPDQLLTKGQLLNCIHAFSSKGCGFGELCQSCRVRQLTHQIFETGVPIVNQACDITLSHSGRKRRMALNAVRIFDAGVAKVLLSLTYEQQDVQEIIEKKRNNGTFDQLETSAILANIGFWELDLQTFVTQGSAVWNKLLGFGDEEEQDFDVWATNIPTQQYKELMHRITRLLRNEDQSFEQRFSYRNTDLGEIWLNLKGYVSQYNKDGRPTKIVGVVQDITAVVSTEQELITQQANQKALLENTEARIWLVDSHYRIIEMNDQFKRGFKAIFSIEYSKGDSFIGALPQEACNRWRNLLDKCFMGNSLQVSDTVRMQNADRHFETRLTPVSVDDTVIAVSCYLTEVTVQKRYEQMLKLARKTAEDANKAKSQFLANMSHEIRTPLNAILGFSEILQATEKEPEKTAYLQSIKKSGTMLLNIINDVLDLSKIEAGKIPVNPEFTDVHTLLTDTFEPFIFRASQKKLAFNTDIASLRGSLLYIDGFRFRQIVLNLLSNAVKFTEQGSIQCSAVLDKKSDTSAHFSLQITDTGIGIDRSQTEAIFSPFQQQENQDSRKYEGTGLGLTITKQLVELLGGTIRVESNPDSGSIFSVQFPLMEIREQKSVKEITATDNRPQLNFAGKHALVADDLPDHRKVIGGYLSLYGIKVAYASDGEDVFSQLESMLPDIIFMDLRMPGINGYKAFAELQKNPAWKRIPVVAVTAEAFASEEEIVGNKGFAHLIRKPLQLDELHTVLTLIFRQPAASQESHSAITSGIEDAFVQQLKLMAAPLLRRQPRKDLLQLADFLIDEGSKRGLVQLVDAGNELKYSTNTFNIVRIREIISELL